MHEEPEPLAIILLDLPMPQAYALAQLCKRLSWTDARGMAVDDDEARAMLSACNMLRASLGARGITVR